MTLLEDLRGFVVDGNEESRNALAGKIANRLVLDKAFPKTTFMELVLTEDCNLRCSYCFVKDKNPRRMSWNVAKTAVDFLITESGRTENVHILFFGGEPLLELDLIKRVIEYANGEAPHREKKFSYSMTTNGTLLTEETCRYLRDSSVKYLVSVDGTAETHDRHRKTRGGGPSFHLIEKNFRHMKRFQPWQGTRYTIHPDSVGALMTNVRVLHDMGVNQFIIGPAMAPDVPWPKEAMETFAEQLDNLVDYYVKMQQEKRHFRLGMLELGSLPSLEEARTQSEDALLQRCRTQHEGEWGCGAGRGRLAVNTRGELYGCSRLLTANGLARDGLGRLGSLQDGFDVHARAKLIGKRESARTTCLACSLRDACTGGCPAVNFQFTGDMYRPSLLDCEFTRLYLEVQEKAQRLLVRQAAEKEEPREKVCSPV